MYREKKNYLKLNPASNFFYGGLLVSSNNSSYNSKKDTIRSLGCILFWAVDKTKKITRYGAHSIKNKLSWFTIVIFGKYNLLSLPQEVFFKNGNNETVATSSVNGKKNSPIERNRSKQFVKQLETILLFNRSKL